MILPNDIHTGVTVPEAEALAAHATGLRVLECGSWYGYSTVVMGSVAEKVTAVDWHHGDRHAGVAETLDTFRENLRRYGVEDRVEVHVGRFEDVLPSLPPQSFDGAFADGMHDAPSVRRDLDLIAPLIRPGGWLLVHDYRVPESWAFEVMPTLDAWLVEHPDWTLVGEVEKLAILRHTP